MMHRNAPAYRKGDRERLAKLHSLPCAACVIDGNQAVCGKTEAHHFKSGNKRIGHQSTIALGQWHHQGIPLDGYTHGQMELIFGPSLARSPKSFRERYGTDGELLERTNDLLEKDR